MHTGLLTAQIGDDCYQRGPCGACAQIIVFGGAVIAAWVKSQRVCRSQGHYHTAMKIGVRDGTMNGL